MKNRTLKEQLIRKHLSDIGPIQVLTGARQTVKTTLLKNNFSDYEWVFFDDPVLSIQYA